MLTDKRVLLVGAHPDDIEIMAGGTMSKYLGHTAEVRSVIFAPCLEDPLNEGILGEYQESMQLLGVQTHLSHTFPRDILEAYIQDVRDLLYKLKQAFEPDVIFCPSVNDLHQDHRAVASACQTIFRDSAWLIRGEIVRSTVHFTPNLFVILDEEDISDKLRLLDVYKTQLNRASSLETYKPHPFAGYTGPRTYFNQELVKSIARFRGCQVSTQWAEAFELWRMTDR